MTKEVLYLYMGTNGRILSPVHLDDAYYVRRLKITPDNGKYLEKDGVKHFGSVVIPEEDLDAWVEK